MKISLKEWNEQQPRKRCMETVRRWARAGMLYPAPEFDGYEYLIDSAAVKHDPRNSQKINIVSLMERVNGPTTQSRQSRATAKLIRKK
ncbi:excisionase [Yersinia similis]|uniref:Excisionase n=1 Tax=Yersinia similis TaxID=367190 RepID=A0ABN4CPG5_9GAMM|nr:excisionase [Yersinia similis]